MENSDIELSGRVTAFFSWIEFLGLAYRDPKEIGLPSPTINSSYIFAGEDVFLCYPNNYNHYVNYYKNTFQHGGVSLEEMIVPVIQMVNK